MSTDTTEARGYGAEDARRDKERGLRAAEDILESLGGGQRNALDIIEDSIVRLAAYIATLEADNAALVEVAREAAHTVLPDTKCAAAIDSLPTHIKEVL